MEDYKKGLLIISIIGAILFMLSLIIRNIPLLCLGGLLMFSLPFIPFLPERNKK